jgi:two-component system response regulator HydG
MKTGKILIVDDNIQILNSLKLLLKNEFEEVTTAKNPGQIHGLLQSGVFDVILLDMNYKTGDNSGNEGIFWLREILKSDPSAIVILITAYGDIELAVKAIKEGAIDFVTKPWDADKLIVTLKNALVLRKSKAEVTQLKVQQKQLTDDISRKFSMFTGGSKAMNEIYNTISKVAKTDANVLILGENGTGKEVIAHEIHRQSKRANQIFLAVDMASLGEGVFESEMFGHMKGAFTDARDDRAGRFETASGGTLLLDEIGNLSMSLQSKLLTVLQNRQVTRMGSNKTIDINIRLITATNKNLETLVSQNMFREDLLFRINTITIELPPLRERKEDIPGLADYFLQQYSCKYEKPQLKFNGLAYEKLQSYSWPGNIRELKHTIEKTVILCDSNIIGPDNVFLKGSGSKSEFNDNAQKLADIEKEAIHRVLTKCNGNLSKAAEILDISRTTLYAKIEKYGLLS